MSDAAALLQGDAHPLREVLTDRSLGAAGVQFSPHTCVHEPETPAEHLYLIDTGQVRIFQVGPDGSTRLASILGSGDWFGLTALDDGLQYGERATTVTSVSLWRLPATVLRARCAALPALERELVVYLLRSLRQAREETARLVFDDCNLRLLKTLLNFSSTAAATPNDAGVELRITHEQLAQAVGAARETVSLALTQLRQKNLLRTGRNRLFFNPDVLRGVCKNMGAKERRTEKSVVGSE